MLTAEENFRFLERFFGSPNLTNCTVNDKCSGRNVLVVLVSEIDKRADQVGTILLGNLAGSPMNILSLLMNFVTSTSMTLIPCAM